MPHYIKEVSANCQIRGPIKFAQLLWAHYYGQYFYFNLENDRLGKRETASPFCYHLFIPFSHFWGKIVRQCSLMTGLRWRRAHLQLIVFAGIANCVRKYVRTVRL